MEKNFFRMPALYSAFLFLNLKHYNVYFYIMQAVAKYITVYPAKGAAKRYYSLCSCMTSGSLRSASISLLRIYSPICGPFSPSGILHFDAFLTRASSLS